MTKFKFKVKFLMVCLGVAAIIISALLFISFTFGPMLAKSWLFTHHASDSVFENLFKTIFRIFYVVGCLLLAFRFASAVIANYHVFKIKLKHTSWIKSVKGLFS